MSQEIERKFLVQGNSWQQPGTGTLYRQGYLCADPSRTVRVRLAGDEGKLTIKGQSIGITRTEFEYDIPASDASELLSLCVGDLIEKMRHVITFAGKTWEVDEFSGANSGLIIAEIELSTEDEAFAKPPWVGLEVSDDKRYFNSYLSQHPFSTW